MSDCSITKYLQIEPGSLGDYHCLSRFHYRSCGVPTMWKIYKIIDTHPARARYKTPVGVIIYSMPTANCRLRNIALGSVLDGLAVSQRLQWLNDNMRTISRVIIEPRYRSLSLAAWLVSETTSAVDMPYVEALATMGRVNPFFERAKMRRYESPPSENNMQLLEALSYVGADENMLVDPSAVHSLIDGLDEKRKLFINTQIARFMQVYGSRKQMPAGLERTEFVLSRLTDRPVYYLKQKIKSKR